MKFQSSLETPGDPTVGKAKGDDGRNLKDTLLQAEHQRTKRCKYKPTFVPLVT